MKRRHWLHAASLALALVLVAFEATASRTPVVLGGGYDTQTRQQGQGHRRSLLGVGDSKWWPWNWGKKAPLQADILLEIKQQLIQDDTSGTTYADQLPSWVGGTDPCADGRVWRGVTCGDAGDGKGTEVVGLSLTHLEPHLLHRFIPDSLSKLTSLESLDLTDSGVGGVIPPDLRSLSQLQVALLSNNHLTDASVLLDQATPNPSASFMPTPAAFPSLSVLNLANNNLTGSVPHAITSMHKLMHLSLAHNRLTGASPLSLDGRGLAELQRLELQGNAFNGALSGDLPPKLTWLDFSNNAAPLGPLIPCLGAAPNLQVVHMASSGLSGELCEGMSNLRLLRELDLHNNSLSGVAGTNGSLSAAWGSLTQLTYLDLSSNNFTGQLPEEWAQLTNLMYLNVSNNPLTGTVPAALAKLLMSGDAEYDFSNTSLVLRGGTAATAAAIMDHIAEQAGNVQQLIHDHPTSAWVTICLISGSTLLLALLAGVVWRYRTLYMAGWRPLTVEQQPGWVAKHEVRLKTMLGGAAARWAATGGKRRQEKEEKE